MNRFSRSWGSKSVREGAALPTIITSGLLAFSASGLLWMSHGLSDAPPELDAPAPAPTQSVEGALEALAEFDTFRRPYATHPEAVRMLAAAGLVPVDPSGPTFVTGRVPGSRTLITIWPQSYRRRGTYGIRYGGLDAAYFGSNDTYFEVTIPKDQHEVR